ncbi:MAG: diaminopimelate epimerase [Maribacter sp.]|nr:MAG: diaminopimelate epimerase [Maribacter sp.]
MTLEFYKYQGTGNDFVMIDNRHSEFSKNDTERISFLCDRKFGIGADGLILLEEDEETDFRMVYFNADGKEGSMCGNGGRCLVAFAKYMEVIDDETTFNAVDGLHKATIENGVVSLQMQDVTGIMVKPTATFLDTGSPHHVQLVKNLDNINVFKEGKKLRYGLYGEKGSNVNFVEQKDTAIFSVRTYERGVEDETLSCGTGVTAVAIAMHNSGKTDSENVLINSLGGELQVRFEKNGKGYKNIHLVGPAKMVYKGEIEC